MTSFLSKLYIKDLYQFKSDIQIKNANKVVEFMKRELNISEEPQEILYCLCLNNKNNIVNIFENSQGTSNFSCCSSKDILKKALISNADGIILVHNHPSGDPLPSSQDNEITNIIKKACNYLDIKFLDHIIIGKNYYSYRESEVL